MDDEPGPPDAPSGAVAPDPPEHPQHHEHQHPEGTAPFLPDAWWGMSVLRRREVAVGLVVVLVLAVAVAGYVVLGDDGGSGSQEAAAEATATTGTAAPAAGSTTATTVTGVDPDTYVASMSPQRVETFNSLAMCESSGDWSADTGNGFYGGLQFTLDSWRMEGGSGNPADASQNEQIMRASLLQADQGWVAWPQCAAQLGLT